MSSRHLIISVLVTLITIFGIYNFLLGTRASITSSTQATSPVVIGGRWQLVHASLALPPLPTSIPASPVSRDDPQASRRRVDFRRRKRDIPLSLHFAHEVQRKPRVSLRELVVSFRRIAQEDAMRPESRKRRSRLGRINGRRGHSGVTSH